MTFGLWILDFVFWNSGQGFGLAQSPWTLDFGPLPTYGLLGRLQKARLGSEKLFHFGHQLGDLKELPNYPSDPSVSQIAAELENHTFVLQTKRNRLLVRDKQTCLVLGLCLIPNGHTSHMIINPLLKRKGFFGKPSKLNYNQQSCLKLKSPV